MGFRPTAAAGGILLAGPPASQCWAAGALSQRVGIRSKAHLEYTVNQPAKILLQLDADPQPSVFDAVVAIDSGVDCLLRHGNVTPENVRDLVYGAIFTRGGDELKHTAIFIGGSNVEAGEKLLAAVEKTFFGPRVSVMLDANGANTTAVAAVLSMLRHIDAAGTNALVLGGTGPVGLRVARLLARLGANVRLASRKRERAASACETLASQVPNGRLEAVAVTNDDEALAALEHAQVLIAAGAAGVQLLSSEARARATRLQVAIDLNAVPPVGLQGIHPSDKATQHNGTTCYGALGVGGLKMKIHKACIRRLFESADQVLDAEQILEVGRTLS